MLREVECARFEGLCGCQMASFDTTLAFLRLRALNEAVVSQHRGVDSHPDRFRAGTQKPIWARPRSVRSSTVARPLKSTSKSMAAKSGAERPERNASRCSGR